MPPPRRKSCFSCIKAKRRCSLNHPVCQRCSDKGLACDYGDLPEENATPHPSASAAPQGTPLPVTTNMPSTSHIPLDTPADLLNFDAIPMELTLAAGQPDPSNFDWTLVNDAGQWLPYHTEDYVVTGQVYEVRTRFDGKQLKTLPVQFHRKGSTPFIHRAMYSEHTPTAISDSLSACALYSSKNPDNETFVFRDITRKVRSVIDATNIMSPPSDLLAASQALLLYQMIRLFDGDIRLRADAEADEAILMSWIVQLQARLRRPSAEPLLLDDSSMANLVLSNSTAWQKWIFEESLRRTVLTAYLLQGVYMFLKKGYDTVSEIVESLEYTAQAALWDAPSEFHWRNVWLQDRHLAVSVREWDQRIPADVKPEELCELGVMIMATIKGMEILTEWLGSANLAKYGLEWGSAETKD